MYGSEDIDEFKFEGEVGGGGDRCGDSNDSVSL
jgi:hypothetical protein